MKLLFPPALNFNSRMYFHQQTPERPDVLEQTQQESLEDVIRHQETEKLAAQQLELSADAKTNLALSINEDRIQQEIDNGHMVEIPDAQELRDGQNKEVDEVTKQTGIELAQQNESTRGQLANIGSTIDTLTGMKPINPDLGVSAENAIDTVNSNSEESNLGGLIGNSLAPGEKIDQGS